MTQTVVTHIPSASHQAYYHVSQVAKLLGLTTKQVYRWMECGFISSCRIQTPKRSRLRIPRSEVMRLVQHHTLKPRRTLEPCRIPT